MSYQKLLLEYAQTLSNFEKSLDETGGKRLRWEKDEAMGNSKFRWTGTKVRYAHVVNRSLQMNLDKNVSVWAKTHGSMCNEIESKQRELWVAQIKRNNHAGTSYLDRQGKPTLKIVKPMIYKQSITSPQQLNAAATPFSTASDFSIYRRPYDPNEREVQTDSVPMLPNVDKPHTKQSSRSRLSSRTSTVMDSSAYSESSQAFERDTTVRRASASMHYDMMKEPLLARRRYSAR